MIETPTFSDAAWQRMLAPYLDAPASVELVASLERYLKLLMLWNARINLTSVRDPVAIVQRHFGESLFAARYVPRGTLTLLDHGSGAGFPGIPIAVARPEIAVTLSESQGKKASFLREVVRNLGVRAEVHASRTEDIPFGQSFDCVTMRAVDGAGFAVPPGANRVNPAGCLLILGKKPGLPSDWRCLQIAIPNAVGFLSIARRDVPRGT